MRSEKRLYCGWSVPFHCTNCARGPGGALKLPQRVRAEPGRQTFMVILWCENEVWEAPLLRLECFLPLHQLCYGSLGALKLPHRVRAEPGHQTFLVILWSEN